MCLNNRNYMLKNGTGVWFKKSQLANEIGEVVGWLYDSYYLIRSVDDGIMYYVYPEYVEVITHANSFYN